MTPVDFERGPSEHDLRSCSPNGVIPVLGILIKSCEHLLYTKPTPSIPLVVLTPTHFPSMASDNTHTPSKDVPPVQDDDAASVHSEDSEARAEREAKAAAEALYQKSISQENRHLLRHQIW